MSEAPTDPRVDRLFELLPAIYRTRDAEQGGALQALLRVIAEQVNVLEDDIAQLYENWFIETAQDWAVPYIADLIGYRPVESAGDPSLGRPALNRRLIPRREVANTLRSRRRKGTLALLEELARDVAGWPGRAVETYRLLAYAQSVGSPRPERGRSAAIRDPEALERLDGPFDEFAHSVDVRRIQSRRSQGRYNIPSVGLYLWRLAAYSVSETPATCLEAIGPNAFAFSVLGNDTALVNRPEPETDPSHVAAERNLPVPIRRRLLENDLSSDEPSSSYGEGRSFRIWRGVKHRGRIRREAVPAEQLIVADLGDWHAYRPQRDTIAVDPLLGRMLFPPNQVPAGVWVSYHYGFSADLGGGEYSRAPTHQVGREAYLCQIAKETPSELPAGWDHATSIEAALDLWDAVRADRPEALLEISDSEVYSEQLAIRLVAGERLTIRAANRRRPVIYLLDRERNQPDALTVFSDVARFENGEGEDADGDSEASRAPGGTLTLDGLMIAGRAVHVEGGVRCVTLRHCTLVPGWDLESDCRPLRPAEPSLELWQTTARLRVEKSILGSILVYQDEVNVDPVDVEIADSILDATDDDFDAVYAPNEAFAHAVLTLRRCTVFGGIRAHAIALGEDCVITGRVRVARRQFGCLRFCYVPPGSRTPQRYRCQPDLVVKACRDDPTWLGLSEAERSRVLERERARVRPTFDSVRYGTPRYARLGSDCAVEIRRGAESESEMGAFHDLYAPQRLINLEARLNEFSPARTDIAVILAD